MEKPVWVVSEQHDRNSPAAYNRTFGRGIGFAYLQCNRNPVAGLKNTWLCIPLFLSVYKVISEIDKTRLFVHQCSWMYIDISRKLAILLSNSTDSWISIYASFIEVPSIEVYIEPEESHVYYTSWKVAIFYSSMELNPPLEQ
jgi:hypothetical protein